MSNSNQSKVDALREFLIGYSSLKADAIPNMVKVLGGLQKVGVKSPSNNNIDRKTISPWLNLIRFSSSDARDVLRSTKIMARGVYLIGNLSECS